MFRREDLSNGDTLCIVVRADTEKRLSERCFRKGQHMAGNFCFFRQAEDIFRVASLNTAFLASVQEEIDVLVKERRSKSSFGFCIESEEVVGWSSTDSAQKYTPFHWQERELNARSWAMFVKGDAGFFAPLTNLISFVCELKQEEDSWAVVVHSIYPGTYVGELKGDMSTREGLVWFDWNHPGEPLK